MEFLTAFFYIMFWTYSSVLCASNADPDSIRTKILDHYDSKMPPPTMTYEPLRVTVAFTINYFTLDTEDSVFLVNGWLRMSWNDPRLVFNATSSVDSVLRFGPDELWKPDLTLYNNAYPTEMDHYGDTHLLVSPDGSVLWVPPVRLAAHCMMNMLRWPHDRHTCDLKFGSWTHHGKEIDLIFNPYKNATNARGQMLMEDSSFIKNSEWTLIRSTAIRNAVFYSCCPEPYVDLTFSVTFQRNSPSYVAIFVVPIIFICIVNMLTLLLPPGAGEKVTVAAIEFFIICIFLLYFQAKVPAMGDHLPLLVVLYVINLALVTLTLIISVTVLNFVRNRKISSPPKCCRVFCSMEFTKLLGLGHLLPFMAKSGHKRLGNDLEMNQASKEASTSGQPQGHWEAELSGIFGEGNSGSVQEDSTNLVLDKMADNSKKMGNADWFVVACFIDRIAFVVYVVTNFVLLVMCLA